MNKLKIIFLGTPEFAVLSLEKLINSEFKPELVITQPDKPVGRHQELKPPPVKKVAINNGLEIWQPESLKNLNSEDNSKFNCDLAIVVAYGKIIPEEILKLPRLGFINIHPSLLPKYRGSSPIQNAILNGDKESGVSLILLDKELDHGPILAQEKIKLTPDETASSLHDKLANLSADLLINAIPEYAQDKIKPQIQDDSKAIFTEQLSREDGQINWQKSANEIERQFRAFHPWPGVYTFWDEQRLKVLDLIKVEHEGKPGEIFVKNDELGVNCQTGAVILKKVQLEGKKAMEINGFIKGQREIEGRVLAK